MKVFEFISEIVGWIFIAVSPTGIGAFIGYFCYTGMDEPWGMVVWIALAAIGFVIGAIIATRAWRGKGTVHLLSRTSATPELDDSEP
jgi:hypothetical protein